jgi:type IV secretion system protein TrbJ
MKNNLRPSSFNRVVALNLTVVAFALTPIRLYAQMVVYDPSNYGQNVLTAARSLQQLNTQLTMLANQVKMLQNQALQSLKLPYSSLQSVELCLRQTQTLLNEAQRLAYNISQIDQTFQRLYPQSPTGLLSQQQLLSDTQARRQNSLAGYQDALRVQAGVVQGLGVTQSETSALVSSSQSAAGILQAAQAGNQLVALLTKQVAELTAATAAHARSQNLEGARQVADEQAGRNQLNLFLTTQQGYQPQPVQMFH